jgi:hypothetical protein
VIRDFINAATGPTATISLFLAVIGFVLYFSNAKKNTSDASRRRVLSVGLAVLSLAVFGSNVALVLSTRDSDAAYRNTEQPYSLSVVVSGVVETSVQSERQSFRVSSGQLNVGCNDERSADATWQIVQGATDIQSTARWQNADNVKDQTVGIPHQEDSAWTVSGRIVGRDKSWIGDCPGGGHGELVLDGSYRPPDTTLDKTQVLLTYGDRVSRGQKVFIPLPTERNKIAKVCEIKVAAGSDVRSVKYPLITKPDGKLMLGDPSVEGVPLAVTLNDNRLAISIP